MTIPEGLSVAATLKLISEKSKLKLADLQAAAKDTKALELPSYAKGKLEGFLFPDTYDLEPDTTAAGLVKSMVDEYKAKVDDAGLVQKAAAVNLSPYEMVIVASLVEKETQQADERAKVARVIYNRLDQDFFLGIDAAVLYGLGRSSGGLSEADLREGHPVQQPDPQGAAADADREPGDRLAAGRGGAGQGALALLRARRGPPGPPPVHRRPGRVQHRQGQVPGGPPLLAAWLAAGGGPRNPRASARLHW